MTIPFLIDTDAGSDDAVAILMALRHPDVDVHAITVVAGNVPLDQGVVNALYFSELCDADVPVFAGADRPLLRDYVSADWFHGADGLGDWGDRYKPRRSHAREVHAVDAIIETARSTPGLVIVTLGPLTNLALGAPKSAGHRPAGSAMHRDGRRRLHQRQCHARLPNTISGVTRRRPASSSALGCRWRWSAGNSAPATLCSRQPISKPSARSTHPIADFTIDCNRKGMIGYEIQTGEIGISLPDGVAMAVAIDPSICISQSQHYVDVECDSELTRGMTVVDKLNLADDVRNAPVWRELLAIPKKPTICWELDAARWKELLLERLR